MPGPTLLATDPREEELLALYVAAEKLIARKINAALATGAKGTAAYFENQNRSIQRELERLHVQAAPLERSVSASAYTVGVAAVEATVDRSEAFSNVHTAAVDVVVGNLAGRLRHAEEFVGRMVNDTFRRIALEQTGLALASGLDARSQRIAIERELRRNGITAFVDRRGRRWTLGSYARMVTRTTTREAATAGTTNRLREVGLDLVTISTHPGSCPICKPYQGKTYSISGYSHNYPHATVLPPIHPNCRHVVSPARASFEDFEAALGLGADPAVEGQLRLGEETPEEVSPETFQRRLRAMAETPLGQFLTPYTVAELRKMRPFLMHDGKVGGALKPTEDGHLEAVSLFNHGGPRGSGSQMLQHLVEQGADRLDCIGDQLRAIYEKSGFRVVERIEWDDTYAPEGWDYEKFGRPAIYVMEMAR